MARSRARIRRRLDPSMIKEMAYGPGSDPRSWVVLARIDVEEDAVRLEKGTGWVADVTFTSGQLSNEPAIPCRVALLFGGNGSVRNEPVSPGCEVVVLIPDGDPNVAPIIVGALQNPEDCIFPTSVNGTEIDEAYALATHLLVTPHAVDEQVAGNIRVKTALKHSVLADGSVELAVEGADQSFVRGNDQQQALDQFATALKVWTAAASAAIGPAMAAPQLVFETAIIQLQTDLLSALSFRIKGE